MYDSGLGIYGNKKLLDAAGVKYPKGLSDAWTADEFTAALKALEAKDSDGKVLDLQENNGLTTEWGTYGFSPIVWSAGGSLLKDGKAEGALDSPKAVSALKTFQSWKTVRRPQHRRQRLRQGPRGPQLGRPLDVPRLQQGPR